MRGSETRLIHPYLLVGLIKAVKIAVLHSELAPALDRWGQLAGISGECVQLSDQLREALKCARSAAQGAGA